MADKIYEYDIGTEIKLDSTEDLTGYNVLQIHYLKPDGTEGYWEAQHVETTKARYVTTTSGDLTPNGVWKLQLYVDIPTWRGRGETVEMRVWEKWS